MDCMMDRDDMSIIMDNYIDSMESINNSDEIEPILKKRNYKHNKPTVVEGFAADDSSRSNKGEEEDEVPKQRNGTVLQAIFNFSNAPLGAGMLSFPYTFYCTGFIAGLVLSGIIIILSIITLYILATSSFIAKDPKTNLPGFRSYQACIEHYLGKWLKKLSEFTMLFYATGACMVYFVVIGEFIGPVALVILPEWFFLTRQKIIMIVFGCIIVFPLLLLKNMRALWFTSFLAVGCAWLLSFFMLFTGIQHLSSGDMGKGTKPSESLFFIQDGLYNNVYPLFFLAVPIKCFGYMGHVLLFPITYEVKKATPRKINLIIVVSIAGVSVIYLINGISGWYAFGVDVQENILNNFSGVNYLANFVRFACGLNILFSFPIQNYGARLTINSLIYGDSNKENGIIFYLFMNLCLYMFMLACALLIPGLAVIFSFIGSIGAVTLIFFFPSLLCFTAMKNRYKKKSQKFWKYYWIVMGVLLMILAVFFMVTGVIASVFKFIEAVQKHQF